MPSFSTVKFLCFPSFPVVTVCSPHIRKLCCTSSKLRYLYNFGILLHGTFLSHSIIHSFVCSFNFFRTVWTHRYLCAIWGYNPVLLYSVPQFFWFWPMELLSWILYLSEWPLTVCDLFHSFLPFWHYRILQPHFHISCPSTRISHFSKEPWFFLLEYDLRNQDLATKCAHCYWAIVASGPSLPIPVCVLTSVYNHIYKYVYVQLALSVWN